MTKEEIILKDGDYYMECTNIEERIYDVYSIYDGELSLMASDFTEKDAEEVAFDGFLEDSSRIIYQEYDGTLYKHEYKCTEVEM